MTQPGDTGNEQNTFADGEEDAKPAKLVTKIYINEEFDILNTPLRRVYREGDTSPFGDVSKWDYLVKVNDVDKPELKSRLVGKWYKKGADGNYAAVENDSEVSTIGEYEYVVFLAAEEGICSEASLEVKCVLTARTLELTGVAGLDSAKPGSTVGEFKNRALDKAELCAQDDSDVKFAISQFLKPITVEVYKVVDGKLTGDALKDADKFYYTEEYAYTIKTDIAETYAGNYVLDQSNLTGRKLTVANVTVPKLEVTAKDSTDPKKITKTYDGKAIEMGTDEAPAFDVKLTYTDDSVVGEISVPFEYKKLEKTWKNVNNEELEKAPVDAGTYTLTFKYPGETGVYAEAEDTITVVIEPAHIAIVPKGVIKKNDKEVKFFSGQREADVVNKITYEVQVVVKDAAGKWVPAKDKDGKDIPVIDYDPDAFWGFSYADNKKKQAYAPVFKLQRVPLVADPEDPENPDKMTPAMDEGKKNYIYEENNGADLDRSQYYTYRAVFAGKKAVYTASGSVGGDADDVCDINEKSVYAANGNYDVVTDKDLVESEDYYITITVNEGKKVEIDVSKILAIDEAEASSYEAPIERGYDSAGLFAERKEYKLAVVTSKTETGTDGKPLVLAEATNRAITYSWERVDTAVPNAEDPTKYDVTWTPWQKYVSDDTPYWSKTPYEPGIYRLEIRYDDPSYEYETQTAEVIYSIVPRYVSVQIDKYKVGDDKKLIPLPVYAQIGATVGSFAEDFYYRVYMLDNKNYEVKTPPDRNDPEKTPIESGNWYHNSDDIDWIVQRLAKDDTTGADTDEWVDCAPGEVYREGYTYRVTGRLDSSWDAERYTDHDDLKNPAHNNAVETIYFNVPQAIELVNSAIGDRLVNIKIDVDKIDPNFKEYDGKPFVLGDLSEIVTITDAQTGEVIPIYDPEKDKDGQGISKNTLRVRWYNRTIEAAGGDDDYWSYLEEAINAGAYDLVVSFTGDPTYAGNSATATDAIRIVKRKLTITPQINDGAIVGGTRIDDTDNYIEPGKWLIDNCADRDKDAFTTYRRYQYDVDDDGELDDDDFRYDYAPFVTDSDWENGYFETASDYLSDYMVYLDGREDDPLYGRYRSNTKYTVRCGYIDAEDDMAEPYRYNYEVVCERSKAFKTASGVSEVYKYSTYPVREAVERDKDIPSHAVYTCLALPYDTNPGKDAYGNDLKEGNYFYFGIRAPWEFETTCYDDDDDDLDFGSLLAHDSIYRNSVEKAGGFIVRNSINVTKGQFAVGFRVEPGAKDATFTIRWAENYVETFTVMLSKATLGENSTKAVAPASLAFNAVAKKMAVGEVQMLDVKIKKKQIDDIVALRYKVTSGKDILNVTEETGVATALSKGTATVEVYAVRKVDNEFVAFEKPKASVKITVTDVAKPVIKSVTAKDDKVTVKFTCADGYRQEIYVLEGKSGLTDKVFEPKIASMKDNDWKDIFAIAPYYVNGGDWNLAEQAYIVTLKMPKHFQDYTVYVRNVSGERSLADGSVVKHNAKGAVKVVKTTKANLQALSLKLDQDWYNDWYYENYPNVPRYGWLPLTIKKPIKISVQGMFDEIWQNGAADYKHYYDNTNTGDGTGEYSDHVWIDVPLKSKQDKDNYENPKLSYYVVDSTRSFSSYKGYGFPLTDAEVKEAKEIGYTVNIGADYYKPSTVAVISKTGALKLKGVGRAYVIVYDSVTYADARMELNVYGKPTKVAAKAANTKVGQEIDLYDYLTYSEGSTKLPVEKRFIPTHMFTATPVFSAARSDYYKLDGSKFVVNKAGKYTVDVTDYTVKSNEKPTSLTIKVNAGGIDPVKALKKYDVYDNQAKISFTYTCPVDKDTTGAPNNTKDELFFRVEVKDARGAVIVYHTIDEEGTGYFDHYVINKGKRTDYYVDNSISGLIRKSSYKVTVTACYRGAESRAATTSFKTTDIPVSYRDYYADIAPSEGGINIYAENLGHNYNNSAIGEWLINHPNFTSGNTYLLRAEQSHPFTGGYTVNGDALDRGTDTLLWKSTNTKVATVSAVKGNTATLKAVAPGSTKIELSSRITKKVIARYTLYVKSVGQGKDFYGDVEYDTIPWDPSYAAGVERVTLENDVTIVPSDGYYKYKYVYFIAETLGRYTFKVNGSPETVRYAKDGTAAGSMLKPGEKVYLRVDTNSGSTSYKVHVDGEPIALSSFTAGTMAVDFADAAGGIIAFEAPEAGYYTFTSTKVGFLEIVFTNDALSFTAACDSYTTDVEVDETTTITYQHRGVALRKGQTIYLDVKGGSYDITVAASQSMGTSETTGTVIKNEKKWFTYVVPATGAYDITVESTGETKQPVSSKYYESLANVSGTVTADNVPSTDALKYENVTLTKDNIVALMVTTAANDGASFKVVVTPKTKDVVANGTESSVTLKAGESAVVPVQITKTGYYELAVDSAADDKKNVSCTYTKKGGLTGFVFGNPKPYKLDAGTVVYVTVTSEEPTKEITVKVNIIEAVAKEVKLDQAASVEVVDDCECWYTFTAKEHALYNFTCKQAEGDTGTHTISAAYYEKPFDGKKLGDLNCDGDDIELTTGQSIAVKIAAASSAEGKTKFNATIKKLPAPATLEAKEYKIPADIAKNTVKYYCYTAEKAGSYTFAGATEVAGVAVTSGENMTASGNNITNGSKTYDLSAGEKVYFKVTTGDAEGSVTFTITLPVEVKEMKSNAWEDTVKKDETVWLSYFVKEEGRYAITLTKPNEEDSVEYYENGMNGSATTALADGRWLKAGKTVYFKVTTTHDPSSKIKIELEKINPASLTAGQDNNVANVTNTKSQWVKFTAEISGRYAFRFTSTEDVCSYASYDGKYDGTLGNSSCANGLAYYMSAGQTYYFCVRTDNDTAAQSAKIKVTKIDTSAADKQLGSTAKTIEMPADNEYTWYSFKATEDGIYTVKGANQTEGSTVNMKYDENIANSFSTDESWNAASKEFELTEGDTILFGFYGTDKAKVDVSVEKRTVTSLKVGENKDIAFATGTNTKYFSLTPYNDGMYTFWIKPQAAASVTSISTGNELDYETDADNNKCIYAEQLGTAGGEINFSVTVNASADAKVDIVIEKAFTRTLTEGAESAELDVPGKDGNVYLKFVVSGDGLYRIDTAVPSDDISIYQVDPKNKIYTGTSVKNVIKPYQANETVYYRVSNSAGTAAKIKVKVVKLSTKDLSLGTTKVTLAADTTATICKIAMEQTGPYVIKIADPEGSTVKIDAAEVDGADSLEYWWTNSSTGGIYVASFDQKEDEIYYLDLKLNAAATEAKSVDVIIEQAYSAANTIKSNGTKELKIPANSYAYLKVVIDEAGAYTLKQTETVSGISICNAYETGEVYSYGDPSQNIGYSNVNGIAYYAVKNTTGAEATVSVTVAETNEITKITSFPAKFESLESGYTYYKYVANKWGAYKFEYDFEAGEANVNGYYAKNGNTYNLDNEALLRPGDAIYFWINVYGSADCTINLKATVKECIVADLVHAAQNARVETRFTAPSSGTYIFMSAKVLDKSFDSYDTTGYLRDENGSELAYNDDDAGDLQFKISYDLTEGQTVILDSGQISNNELDYYVLIYKDHD